MFTARPFAPRIRELVLKYLFDEQVEVRAVASVTLAGFYQCGFIQVAKKDLVKIDHLHFLDKHCLIYRNIFAWWAKRTISSKSMARKWHQWRLLSNGMVVSIYVLKMIW
jgi:hypothetical protein